MPLPKTSSPISVIIFLTNILLANSYSRGPPESVCTSMKPGHYGSSPQSSAVPFQLAPEGQLIEAGETLELVLKSTGSEQFKGFIVRAFESGSGNSYGTFEFGSSTSP